MELAVAVVAAMWFLRSVSGAVESGWRLILEDAVLRTVCAVGGGALSGSDT